MPKLYDRQANEWRDIADHLVEDAYKSGRFLFKKDAEVNVQLPDGRYGTVAAEILDDVLQAGGTYDLAVDRQERIEQAEYGGKERELEALFLAAGRGLTFGLSDVAAEKFGDYSEEELRKLEEYNPTISAVGEIGGAVLPAFFTGGTSTAARILSGASALTPAGWAARAGIGMEKLTASGMARAGFAQADNVADKMIRGGASIGAAAGVEGVIFGAGETFAEEELGRADRTAEQMLANIGSVGLLSGGIGAAMGAGPGALTKAFQAFHSNRFSKGLGDKVAKFSDDLTAAMTSGDRATIAKFRDPEFLDRYIEFDKIRKGATKETESFVNSFLADMETASSLTTGSVKGAEMRDLAKVADPQITLSAMTDTLVAARNKILQIDDPSKGKLLKAVDEQIALMGASIENQLKRTGHMPPKSKIVFDADSGSFMLDFGVERGVSAGPTGKAPLSYISKSETAAVDEAKRKASRAEADAKTAEWESGRGKEIQAEDARLTKEIDDRQRQVDSGRVSEDIFVESSGGSASFQPYQGAGMLTSDEVRALQDQGRELSSLLSDKFGIQGLVRQIDPGGRGGRLSGARYDVGISEQDLAKMDDVLSAIPGAQGWTAKEGGGVFINIDLPGAPPKRSTGKYTTRSRGQAQQELDDLLAQRTAIRSEADAATASFRTAKETAPELTIPIMTDYGDLVGNLFNQLDSFKKTVGSYAYKRRPETSVGFNADAEMNNLYQLMRNTLEDEAFFGKAAVAQKAVNAPFHELLKIAPDFNKKFTVKVAGKRQANSNRIKSFLRRADDFDDGSKIDKQVFEETIRKFQEFASAAKAHYTVGTGKEFDRLARNTEAINKQWADFGELLAAQKELRHLSQTNDSSMSLLAGGAAYAIGGIPGAVVAAAANDIIRPGNAIRRRMVVHNMKSMMTKRIDKSVSRVTNRIMKNKAGGPQRASKVPSILALVGVKSTGDSNEDIAAEMQAIQQIASPDALTARIEKGTADLEDAPMIREELTNATIRQVSMLQGAAAKAGIVESDPLTGQQKITMSDAGKAEYLQVRDTLSDPIGVTTQALEDGTASRTMGRTFAQAFPILFQEFTDKLLGDIREEAEKTGNAISYADNLQLSSFTGIPLSPTLNPGFIGAMQNVMKVTEQGRRPQKRVASLKESANRAILPVEQAMT